MAHFRREVGSVLICVLVAGVVSWSWERRAQAQTGCSGPGYQLPVECTDPQAPKASVCWSPGALERLGATQGGAGQMNLSLWWGVGPGDYPPVHAEIGRSPAPMFNPADAAQQGGAWGAALAERPTLEGMFDLITGVPVIQETDFELPFGGAVFRHTRTYTEIPSATLGELEAPNFLPAWQPWEGLGEDQRPQRMPEGFPVPEGPAAETLWDWHGTGWMMSENPMFLFDASYWGVVADGTPSANPGLGASTRCYFIPDAHRSIPFERRIDDAGHAVYVAPAGFDAVMTYDLGATGSWDSVAKEWITPPETVHVWLHRGAIRYDIAIQRGDVGPFDGGTNKAHHARPTGPDGAGGYGLPHWGLVTRIEDRYGNHMKLDYCPERQSTVSGPVNGCYECAQNCNERGQLTRVRLYAASDAEAPKWTLLYTYREFLGRNEQMPETPESWYPLRTHAVHAIRAYEGEMAIPAAHPCMTLSASHFGRDQLTPIGNRRSKWLNAIDAIDDIGVFQLSADYRNWVVEAKYVYTDPQWAQSLAWRDDSLTTYSCCLDDQSFDRRLGGQPRLIKSMVSRRKAAGEPDGVSVAHRVFRYSDPKACTTSDVFIDRVSLSGEFGPQKVEALVQAVRQKGMSLPIEGGMSTPEPIPDANVNDIVTAARDDMLPWFDPKMEAVTEPALTPKALLDVTFVPVASGRCGDPRECTDAHAFALDYLGLTEEEAGRLVYLHDGHKVFIDARQSRWTGSSYYITRFMLPPEPIQGWQDPCGSGWFSAEHPMATMCGAQMSRAVWHYPYRVIGTAYDLHHVDAQGNPQGWAIPAADQPFWLVVVEERRRIVDDPESDSLSLEEREKLAEKTVRHAFKISKAGDILSHRIWTVDQEGHLVAGAGLQEESVYDEHRRISERRSVGWGSVENEPTRTTKGLVHVFEYPATPASTPGQRFPAAPREIARVGIKEGSDEAQPVYWLSSRQWRSDRPDLLASEKRFKQPSTNPDETDPAIVDVTTYDYQIGAAPGQGGSTAYVAGKTTRLPSARVAPGTDAAGEKQRVERELFDRDGRRVWHGTGRVAPGAAATATGDQFNWDKFVYDAKGQLLESVEDVEPISPPPGLAFEFLRVDASGPAQARHTTFAYDADGNPKRIDHPSGRVDLVVRETESGDGVERRWNFSNLAPNAGGGFTALSPLRIEDVRSSCVIKTDFATVDGVVTESSAASVPHTVFATVTPTYDGAGKLIEAAIEAPSGDELKASVWYDGSGSPIRTREADGTITRVTYDGLGRPERTFRGTNDEHFAWGTAAPVEGQPICNASDGYPDNLTLISRQVYGVGTHDALKPTVLWRYRDRPTDRYFQCGASNNEEQIGWAEVSRYDWRMRPVIVDVHDVGPLVTSPVLRRVVTWYDHADRVRLSATYAGDADLPSSIDPISAAPDAWLASGGVPMAQGVLSATAGGQPVVPLELTETNYSAAGDTSEVVRYDVADPTGATFTASRTWYDHAGRAVYERSAGSGDVRTVYDARGLAVSRSVFAGAQEVERTESVYDADGNAVEIRRLERLPGTSGDALGSANSARSIVFNWFDPANRLVASADFGTADLPGDRFTTGTATPTWQAMPTSVLLASALDVWGYLGSSYSAFQPRITTTGYDVRGRRDEAINERGVRTEWRYDDFGRVVLQIENTEAMLPSKKYERRRTAYWYDAQGRMAKIAALRPDHPATTDWSRADETIQVTEMLFDADVIDSAGAVVSRHNGWVSAVKFPEATLCRCDINGVGGLTVQDIFDFLAAYFAGCLGPNNPNSGCTMSADFNQSGGVTVQDIFDFLACYFAGCSGSWNNSNGDLRFKYTVDGLVASRTSLEGGRFDYAHDVLGRLTSIVASGSPYVGSGAPMNSISHADFAYDALSRLTEATARTTDSAQNHHIVADSLFEYDGLGNLLRERQAFGEEATSATPGVEYGWSAPTSTSPYSRLVSMLMPEARIAGGNPQRRSILFGYGAAGDADSQLGRVRDVTDVFASSQTILARVGYAGQMRRTGIDRGITLDGNGAVAGIAVPQTFAGAQAGDGLVGLDRFGRAKDLDYHGHEPATSADTTLFRGEYAYDIGGNRTRDKLTYRPVGGGLEIAGNDQSWLYTYDSLDRLVDAKHGRIAPNSNPAAIAANSPNQRHQIWKLDDLGNFGYHGSTEGRVTSSWFDVQDGSGTSEGSFATRHTVNQRNEVQNLWEKAGDYPAPPATEPTEDTPRNVIYDHAGRLSFDGVNAYQYDCWGRLVQVSDVLDPQAPPVDGNGQVTGGALGALVVHYTYDAMGRLIARQTPWDGERNALRIERFQHDGARRVQEVVSSRVDWKHPLPLDQSLWPDGQGETVTWKVDREYVHVPSGAGGYVDEYLAQFDGAGADGSGAAAATGGRLAYILQDANYNVVAASDAQGHPAAQFSYYPYGVVKTASIFDSSISAVRMGHQGLFFDRFDVPWATDRLVAAGPHGNTGWKAPDQPESMPGRGVYQNRNRSYDPGLGRFVQRDPNGGGLTVANGSLHLMGMPPAIDRFDPRTLYGDGMNLSAYAGNNALARTDSGGLDFGLMAQLALMAINAYTDAEGTLDEAREGLCTVFGLGEMLGAQAFDQEMDVDWAMDWSQPDNGYSRSGIVDAAMYRDPEGVLDSGGGEDKGPSMAGVIRRKSPWARTRVHGARFGHWDKMRASGKQMIQNGVNPRSIRTHQALVDARGNKLSNLKPDVQGVDKDGRVHIVEIANGESAAHARIKLAAYRTAFKQNNLRGTFRCNKIEGGRAINLP